MQKTHFGLRNVWLEPADMARHASLSATVRTRRRKKREKGIFPALHGDITVSYTHLTLPTTSRV